MRASLIPLTCVLLALSAQQRAFALPVLQLYVEGATYNTATESWEFFADSAGNTPIRLWTIGAVGSVGTISNVRLAVSFDQAVGDIGIKLTPSTTGGYLGFTDPSTPIAPILNSPPDGDSMTATAVSQDGNGFWFGGVVTDGSLPQMTWGNGWKDLPRHGEFTEDTYWKEFALGDFDQTDSVIGDFTTGGLAPTQHMGQINVYEVTFNKNTTDPVRVHFDLYDSIEGKNRAKGVFAPFSHDADATGSVVPEPASLSMLALGTLVFGGGIGLRRRRKAHAA